MSSTNPFQKEWDRLCRKERRFIERRADKKESRLNNMLAEKIPEKLQQTLDSAFEKAFFVIFEKGSGIIEKTYSRQKIENEFKVNCYADEINGSRSSLRAFSRKAGAKGSINTVLSGASGVGLGLFGIGLPDIPIFIGTVIKCLNEMSLNYGFDYNSEEERYFMLLIIEGAVSYGEHLKLTDDKIEAFMHDSHLPLNYDLNKQVSDASGMLSKELLYMKFLQGIPVAGMIGGAYDLIYMKRISEYAELKYHKRFLLNYRFKNRK